MYAFLRLLVHHGVWNELNHDVFKSIIATCKRIHNYVCSNKPLVKMLFRRLATRVDDYDYGRPQQYWILGSKREGVCMMWYSNSKDQLFSRFSYRNNLLHGEYTQWYNNGKMKKNEYYRHGYNHGDSKSWFANGQITRTLSIISIYICIYIFFERRKLSLTS